MIVVVIMAVIAGVILPRFTDTTNDAKQSTLKSTLHTVRSQAEMYRMNHLGKYPAIQNNDLPQLVHATNANGEIGPSGPTYPYGPYIVQQIPVNPFDDSSKVSQVATPGAKPSGAVGNLGGWQYDDTTGDFWPNNGEYYQ